MCLLYLWTMEASDSQELRLLHRIEWKSDQDVLTETETLWSLLAAATVCKQVDRRHRLEAVMCFSRGVLRMAMVTLTAAYL